MYASAGGKQIGIVKDVVVTSATVPYVLVISVSGFLEVGGQAVAVPLADVVELEGLLVFPGATRASLKAMPRFTYSKAAEKRLGNVASEGCIRIPATLNTFLDRHGLLDASYEQAVAAWENLWVLRPDRQSVATPGQYMVIVDSLTEVRPAWSPAPAH